jgi:IS605 OrfB family transposase
MRRACRVSLRFLTECKQQRINALLQAYRSAVNKYISSLWVTPGRLDKATLARLPSSKTRLSARYRSQALKQAIEIVVSTRKACKATKTQAALPVFKGGAVLDAKFVEAVCDQTTSIFDLYIRLSSLHRGHKIVVPSKRTSVLNKWLAKPGAVLTQGCVLTEKSLTVWVTVPDVTLKQTGNKLGVDIGMNKLIALSDGTFLGEKFKAVRERVAKSKAGTSAKRKAIKARDNYIRQQINRLPWGNLSLLAVEDLKNVKKGKTPKRGKPFRRAAAPWVYRQVLEVLTRKAQENGGLLVAVDPRYTSQSCPSCGTVDRRNRNAEQFKCISCGYSQHADTVGALNVLSKALRKAGSLESPAL